MIQQSHSCTYILQTYNSKRYMRPNLHSSTVHNSQNVSTTRWLDHDGVVCIYSGMPPSHKGMKQRHLQRRGWTQRWSLSEGSQRQRSYDVAYMWNLKQDRNDLIYRTATISSTGQQQAHHRENRLWLPRREARGQYMQTITCRTDKHQGPAVECTQRILSILW